MMMIDLEIIEYSDGEYSLNDDEKPYDKYSSLTDIQKIIFNNFVLNTVV
ncbi:MAG: hypothetical protein CM15mP106_4510 [Candidatus Neomarinimicrobiota bacterium]|nr:MAG: hypothetical protein CM15mP106_4510 [Candidatus Neomarinimicrobiota bacterium]